VSTVVHCVHFLKVFIDLLIRNLKNFYAGLILKDKFCTRNGRGREVSVLVTFGAVSLSTSEIGLGTEKCSVAKP
jgi:hypothetical protein